MEQRTSKASLIQIDKARIIHPLHHPSEHASPLVMVGAEGSVLEDADGNHYIDGLSSLWNVNAGHGRHELAQAAADQMRSLAYTSAYVGFTNEPAIRLADKLLDAAYDNMSAVYFTTGGAESNESAFKLARYYWKRKGHPDQDQVHCAAPCLSRRHAGPP